MIKSFRSRALREFFETGNSRRLSVQNPARIGRILTALHKAKAPEAMNLPGLRFHSLKTTPRRYAVWASENWRIAFGWADKDAIDVELEDYH